MSLIREDLTDHARLLGDVARLYYSGGRSQKEIAAEINRHPSVVVRLLREARERGVVSFDFDTSFLATGTLDAIWSRRLRDQFSLDEASAIQTDGGAYARNEPGEDEYLHNVLGNEIGQRIAMRIRPMSHIAVGSGRAVHQTVRMIARKVQTQRGVLVTALSGRIWMHVRKLSDGSPLERPLDADDTAAILARAFENEQDTRFAQVNHSIYAADPAAAQAFLAEHCAFAPEGQWADWAGSPQIAVVGIGVLDAATGHRLVGLIQNESGAGAGSIRDDLNRVLQAIRENNLPGTGDLTNRLFPLLPLPEAITTRSEQELKTLLDRYGRVIDLVEDLNSKAIVADWQHFRRSGAVIAVAGGHAKVNALWTLLLAGNFSDSKRVVKDLCTDTGSATALCRASAQLREAPAQVRTFYRDLVGRLFLSCN